MTDQEANTIPRGWAKTTLGEAAEKIAMGPFGSNIKVETFVDDGVPVISGTHLNNLKLEDKEYNFITEDHAESLISSNVYRGDVIFTHAGNIGQVSYIPKNSKYKKYVLSQRQFFLRCQKEKLSAEYITYFFKTREGQHKLLANANQTGVPSIAQPVSYLKSISLYLPKFNEQCAMVEVLLSLDDKIELLREQNKTLGCIAQTIYKHWFIDFEFPDKDDNPYKSYDGEMIESKLGKIPKEWKCGTLEEICNFQYGKALKEEERTGKGYTVIGSSGIVGYHDKFLVKDGGIVVGRKGTMGSVIWVEDSFYPIDTTFFIEDKLGVKALYFHYLLLLRQKFEKIGSDSAVPGLNRNSAYSMEIIIPQVEIINVFNSVVDPLFQKMKLNNSQINILSRVRDAILPKLMKGELRVKGFN